MSFKISILPFSVNNRKDLKQRKSPTKTLTAFPKTLLAEVLPRLTVA